jgi:hypothetical protein
MSLQQCGLKCGDCPFGLRRPAPTVTIRRLIFTDGDLREARRGRKKTMPTENKQHKQTLPKIHNTNPAIEIQYRKVAIFARSIKQKKKQKIKRSVGRGGKTQERMALASIVVKRENACSRT